jgi:hypothetical protein
MKMHDPADEEENWLPYDTADLNVIFHSPVYVANAAPRSPAVLILSTFSLSCPAAIRRSMRRDDLWARHRHGNGLSLAEQPRLLPCHLPLIFARPSEQHLTKPEAGRAKNTNKGSYRKPGVDAFRTVQ